MWGETYEYIGNDENHGPISLPTSVMEIKHNVILGENDCQGKLVYLSCELHSCVFVIDSGCSFKDLINTGSEILLSMLHSSHLKRRQSIEVTGIQRNHVSCTTPTSQQKRITQEGSIKLIDTQ